MNGKAEPQPRFDAFDFIPLFPGRLKTVHTGWIVAVGLAVFVVIVLGTVIDGSFGRLSDFQFLNDVRYVFGGSVPRTSPSFPLIRDISSCLFFLIVVAGFALLHRQWRFISAGLVELRRSKTLVPRKQPKSNVVSRLLGVDRLLGNCPDYTALDRLEARFGDVKVRTKILLSAFVVFAGYVLATLLNNSLNQNIFRVLAPTDASTIEQNQWVTMAKQDWWAGQNHPFGLVVYTVLAFLAMSLILTFNVVGVITVYFAAALHFVAEPRADWYNRDGRYGWTPVARIYRTVYWSLILLGLGITMLIAVLGSRVSISVVGLIALYVLLTPIFTIVPWLVFHNVESTAKASRREDLSRALEEADQNDLGRMQLFVAEFARCHEARIRPMQLRTASFSALTTVVLLPVALAILQIYAQVGLGSR